MALKYFNIGLKYILPVILTVWCAVLLAQKIDLPTADLGRHIKNGEILLHSPWPEKWQLLHTNFYSYTEPGHEFVNHHWLSGVIFYFIHQTSGFKGLSVFYIATVCLAFFLFYHVAKKRAGSAVASILAVLVLPIIASRTEIRPEGFTYLLMAIFFWMLWHWRAGKINLKWLFLLPPLMLLWVNLHIGFIFGFVILGAFFLEELIKDLQFKVKNKNYKVLFYRSRLLLIVGILSALAGLANPFFIKGLLYPLNIFRAYGYMIVENQSVMFLERLGMGQTLYFGLFKFLLGLAGASFVIRFILSLIPSERSESRNPLNLDARYKMLDTKDKGFLDPSQSLLARNDRKEAGDDKRHNWKAFPYHEFLLLATAGFLALLATRNFPIFGLLFLPITAANIKSLLPNFRHPAYRLLPALIAVVVIIFGSFRFWESYSLKKANFGLGLMPGVNAAAEFFKKEKIKGPIFNNYDIGGYLIYELYPGKVFTDNRPEAYSIDHFQKDYIPMQQDKVKWEELDEKYKFNVIFFSHRDLTPWGQAFLISTVNDPEWAPVFADQYNIIFAKKNSQNVELIRKYLIPKENFSVTSQ